MSDQLIISLALAGIVVDAIVLLSLLRHDITHVNATRDKSPSHNLNPATPPPGTQLVLWGFINNQSAKLRQRGDHPVVIGNASKSMGAFTWSGMHHTSGDHCAYSQVAKPSPATRNA